MRRFPPTKGVTGYDFGYKPAFSLAVVPTRGPIKQQDTEDETPPVFCHDAWGDTLDIVVSGLASCGCFTSDAGQFIGTLIGGNGSFTAAWNGSIWVADPVGTISMQQYTGVDCATPSGVPEVFDVSISINCQGNNVLAVGIFAVGTVTTYPIFVLGFGAGQTLGDTLINTITCDGTVPAAGGQATVTLP